jgi:hypothetical protein
LEQISQEKDKGFIYMNKKSFFYALLSIVIYEIFMGLINPTGFSLLKVSITLLVWLSVSFSIFTFIKNYQRIKNNTPIFPFYVFMIFLGWNLMNIFRGFLGENNSLETLFGNTFTSLSLLAPFSLAFSIDSSNLKTINNFSIKIVSLALVLYFILLLFSTPSDGIEINLMVEEILFGTLFLVSILPYQSRKAKFIIILGCILIFYLAIQLGNRTTLVRTAFLFLLLIVFYLYRFSNSKLILIIVLSTLLIPFYLIRISISSNQSIISQALSMTDAENVNVDTRTFIYLEVYNDLVDNDKLVIGKGSNATYYSYYFSKADGDSPMRLSVEVGILGILLKGGYIGVFLNLLLFYIAIYLAFFRSNNKLVICLGFMLLMHTQVLFIENRINYSFYYMGIWFIVGVCLSKEIRSLNDEEIYDILNFRNEIS